MMLQDNEATVHFAAESRLPGANNLNLNPFGKVAAT